MESDSTFSVDVRTKVDDPTHEGLLAEARSRGLPIAAIVREALMARYPKRSFRRRPKRKTARRK